MENFELTFNAARPFLFAVFIGVIVSMDVVGLILSNYKDFFNSNNPSICKRPLAEARLHAVWHAGLFFAYMILILVPLDYILITIPNFIASIFICILSIFSINIEINPDQMKQIAVHLSSVFVILFIWMTYKNKISENHRDKVKNKNPLASSKGDVKIVFRIIKKIPFLKTRIVDHAFALAVAVDMLAFSAVLRVYFESGTDSLSSEVNDVTHLNYHSVFSEYTINTNQAWISDFFNVIVFSVIILITVFLIAFVAGVAAKNLNRLKEDNRLFPFIKNCLLPFLRAAEPFLLFFVLANAMPHFFGSANGTNSFIFNFDAFLFSFLLWLLLLFFNSDFVKNVKNGFDISLRGTVNSNDIFVKIYSGKRVRRWIFHTLAFLFVFSVIAGLASVEKGPLQHFVEFLGIAISAFTFATLYLIPDRFENFMNKKLEKHLPLGKHVSLLAQLLIVFLICLAYIYYLHHGLVLTWPEFFIVGLFLFGVYFFVSFLLLLVREQRKHRVAPNGLLDISEMLTALGLMGLGWVIVKVLIWQIGIETR